MDEILKFETNSGMLEIDETGRFQMGNGPSYVSVRLKPDEVDRVIKFLMNRNEGRGWKK